MGYGSDGKIASDFCYLWIRYEAPDATHPNSVIPLASSECIPVSVLEDMSERSVVEMIRRRIQATEMHEVDEWLKFDGKCVREPHL